MLGYYLRIGLASLRRNPVLTALMVAAIALGIGASMTALTVLRAMSGNPLEHKEGRVYRPQVDNWSPGRHWDEDGSPPNLMSYRDAMNLYNAKKTLRQAVMFPNSTAVEPANPDIKPYMAEALFTHGDFFPMFDVPFLYGGGWSAAQDEEAARVVVLSRETNERLFGGENSVGRSLRLSGEDFRVVGVLDEWNPTPRFYETSGAAFHEIEPLFLPFKIGIQREQQSSSNNSCWKDAGNGYQAWLDSECVWLAYWIELASEDDAPAYRAFLDSYADEQAKLGRIARPDNNRLSTVAQWLEAERVVPADARSQVWVAFAFLAVCLVNTVGLLLAKFMARAPEIGLRRAVGASRGAVFSQFLIEAGLVGAVGALTGLALTALGLAGLRGLYGASTVGKLAYLEPSMVAITLAMALVASLLAGLYPTWKACQVTPATQLKSN